MIYGHQIKLGDAGATLATVLLSDSSNYCTVSSVAAPPRHPGSSISNTSNVPCWCARVWLCDTTRTCTSSHIAIGAWCVRVNV